MTQSTRDANDVVVGRDAAALLGCYLEIEAVSGRMLAAARSEDWEQVGALQLSCEALIEQARALGAQAALTVRERREKLRILRRILRNEGALRRLSFPWTARCEELVFPRSGNPGA